MFYMPPVTKNLLIINVLMFAATYVLGLRGIDLHSLLDLHFFLADGFMPHQFVTYLFMHAGFQHIFFNMFALWMFGTVIEQTLGVKKFLTYYFVCGIGAGLLQEGVQYLSFVWRGLSELPLNHVFITDDGAVALRTALNGWRTAGASGAVYGILLAFGMYYPDQRMFIFPIPVPIKAKYFVVGYALIEFVSIVLASNDQVAHAAHLGGMLFGLILILHWRNPKWFSRFCSKFQKPRMRVINGGKRDADLDYNARKKAQEEEIDRILDKVKRHGYGSLSESEKRKLFDADGR
ncbi:MAG: rhomboid family intramembrane serine protease [Bacteroidaceae bacterium]|nr:rhomboid family intramembrane serine protease [Bacteroidaceae bacterium]